MERRNFAKFLGISSMGVSVSGMGLAGQVSSDLKVKDLHNYLRSLHPIEGNSVDQIIIGDPETRITRIGTCWMPYWDTLKEAAKVGVNTLVVHEPTFYTHFDLQHLEEDFAKFPDPAKKQYLSQVAKKKRWIEENKMSIIRCHDVLDILPEVGIPYAFGMALDFSGKNIIRSEKFYNVYQIEPRPAIQVAQNIAAKLSLYGQTGVAFYGDEKRIVKSVGIGTGAICDPVRFMGLEADLRIAIDDSVKTWTQTYYAHDTGNPLIIVNHGTTEERGMMLLNTHLKEHFKELEIIHFKQGCGYKWISGND